MPSERRIVVGAGGHARVVMDALLRECDTDDSLAFADDDESFHGRLMLGRPVLGRPCEALLSGARFHVAVGASQAREQLHLRCQAAGGIPFTVVHPLACASRHSTAGQGSFIAAGAVIGPAAAIGTGVIVNHGAVVDHDCLVDDFSHIAPGATLGGGVTVGRHVLVGAGANILPGLSIGDHAIIGAGAVVIASVPAWTIHVGIPARVHGETR